MRLRQVAMVSRDLHATLEAFNRALNLSVAFNDPAVHPFGLTNAVMPLGNEFLEVVQPTRSDVSGMRYLEAMGGDAGYMVLVQVDEIEAFRTRATQTGVAIVEELHTPAHHCLHFHPKHVGGILMSVDRALQVDSSAEPDGEWEPAGFDWHRHRTPDVAGLRAVELTMPAPEAAATIWADLLGRPLAADGDALRMALDEGDIVFRPGEGRPRFAAMTLAVADPALCRHRAEAAGLAVHDRGFSIGGLRIDLDQAGGAA